MKDTMKTKSVNLVITTFSALMTIKYALKARNSNAIDCFKRKDILHQEVDAHLVQAIRGFAGKYKKHLESKKESELEIKRALDLGIGHLLAKSSAKRIRERGLYSKFYKATQRPKKDNLLK